MEDEDKQPNVPAAQVEERRPSQAANNVEDTTEGSWQVVRPRQDRVVRPHQLPTSPPSRVDSVRETAQTPSRPEQGELTKETIDKINRAKLKKKLYRKRKRQEEAKRRQAERDALRNRRRSMPVSDPATHRQPDQRQSTGRSPLIRLEGSTRRPLEPIREEDGAVAGPSWAPTRAERGMGSTPRPPQPKRQRPVEESPPTDTRRQDKKRTKQSPRRTDEPVAGPSTQQGAPRDEGRTQSYRDAAAGRNYQVVIMGSQEGDPISEEEAHLLRRLLIVEIKSRMREPRPRRRPLSFENSGFQVEPGWLLITCDDEETREWILTWEPPTDRRYVVRRSSEAPWPSRIAIGLGAQAIDPEELIELFDYQNATLVGTNLWRYVRTEGEPGHLRMIFRVPSSTIAWLEAHKWRICCELVKLTVWRVPASSARRPPQQEDQRRSGRQ